ncbi:MAG: hypothetical protein GY773_00440 [Actinomycetia bacterium]|nr:hypothetical protein [Actinomycetes bacterium]
MTDERQTQAPTMTSTGWLLSIERGSAQALHDRQISHPPTHGLWLNQVVRPAFVLGRSQADGVIDANRTAAEGFDVCRRHSGGGIVVVRPGLDTWIDVVIPAESALWSDDVGKAFHWLGEVWVNCLQTLTPGLSVSMYQGPLQGGPAGKLICFASLGPGEVTVEGRKVVGISQRRTAQAARFQCVVTWNWYPELLEGAVAPDQLGSLGLIPNEIAAGLSLAEPPAIELVTSTFIDHLPPVNLGPR